MGSAVSASVGHLSPGSRLRISRPDVPPGYVRLQRVDDALASCRPGDVTVLTAGPGYGKTLAVAAWTRFGRLGGPVAWLAAEEASGLRSFWADMLGALAVADAIPPNSALREIVPGAGFDYPEVELIIAGFADSPSPITMVVDDLHLVSDRAVLDSIRHLIEHQPAQLRLILITRTAADLRLEKLRLDGRLTEITADQLVLTRDETNELCTRAGATVTDGELDGLLERTQGWPAGVRLALLSARDGDVHRGLHRFGGRNEHVAAYLLEEVLENLAPTDRKFLLSTSIVDLVTPGLARALTGRSDSRQVLDDLVVNNALTVRLSDRPDWYAFHPLLRELLVDRLSAESPDAPSDLHCRAAAWFADTGDPISALRHYGCAGEWTKVVELLTTVALPLVLSTQAPALATALAPTDAQTARRPTADTMLASAIVAFHNSDYDGMFRNAGDAERVLGAGSSPPPLATRIVLVLTKMVRARQRDLAGLVEWCDEIIALAAEASRTEIPAAVAYTLIARNNRAIGLFHRGEISSAAIELDSSRQSAESLGLPLMAMAAGTYLALVDLTEGALPDVRRRTAAIAELAERRGWARQPQAMALYAAAALMHVECHELEAAERAIAAGRKAVELGSDTGAWLIVEIAAVGVAVVRGDVFAARAARSRLEAARQVSGPLPALLDTWYRVACTEVRILGGDADDVIAESGEDDVGDTYSLALMRVSLAKAYLAAGRPADAIDVLGRASTFAPYRLQAVEAAILSAVAAARLHRESVALERLHDAVRLAAPIGHIRPFVTAGPSVSGLLVRHQQVSEEHRAFVQQVFEACGGPPAAEDWAPVDPLTDRELVVLRYLPTMYKASEIAADLFVSVNTIKTHQQSIYRKLGVSTRRDAVDRAREHNLI
ncbi:LuxR C-terminal-related transcriptional regulator [Gordonia insulae]|uniref:HTH-type transcriptional regulator MalT n=1 Tax=Gordonia insulae TaxID=2420509 RepID=A0A3G8JQI3_9ACTN|nr:LuxR C-terminal-related transcriptional regulator [Gordonia insulae]AZG47371.1 HTH-type transcriptional regulator MalT [Gordonia insulae]